MRITTVVALSVGLVSLALAQFPPSPLGVYMPPTGMPMPMPMPGDMPGLPGMPMSGAPGMPVPGPMPPSLVTPNPYPGVTSSHCRYLMNAPTPWGTNAAPYKLYTRSYSGEVRRGYPIEVSVLPLYNGLSFFNFTDHAVWVESVNVPSTAAGTPPPPGPPVTHLGVWQVFPKYSAGAGSMKCNSWSRGEDTVGSFEERMIDLLKTQFPFDNRLRSFQPTARHGAAFLWYPDEKTMVSTTAIKFVGKLKAYGQWFSLESSPWRVNKPPPPRQIVPQQPMQVVPQEFGSFVDNFQNMRYELKAMERRMDAAGMPGV